MILAHSSKKVISKRFMAARITGYLNSHRQEAENITQKTKILILYVPVHLRPPTRSDILKTLHLLSICLSLGDHGTHVRLQKKIFHIQTLTFLRFDDVK